MDNIVLEDYIKLFDRLDITSKLDLLSHLTENVRQSFKQKKQNKEALLDRLAGSWSDIDDGIVDDIYNARTSSNKNIDLDE